MVILGVVMLLVMLLMIGGLFFFIYWIKRQNPSLSQEDESKANRSVQEYFNIQGIDKGILFLSGGRYRVFIEGPSLNVPLMAEEEQDLLESRFASLLARANFPLQFYNQNRPLDMDEVMEQLNNQYDDAPEQLKDYAEYLKYYLANMTAERPIWVRRKLVVIPYNDREASIDKVISILDSRARLVLSELEAMGIQARCLTTEEIAQTWYTFLNKDRILTMPFRNVIDAGHTSTIVRGREFDFQVG